MWSEQIKKWYAAVARSTFPSQNVQSTPGSDHFLKFRCQKMAGHCGTKRVYKSECAKQPAFWSPFGGFDVPRCPTEEIERLMLR